jgi:CysZ protein
MSPSPKSLKVPDRGPVSAVAGGLYPLRAFGLLLHQPRLRRYILIPILVNVLLGVTVYAGLLVLGLRAIDLLLTSLPVWVSTISHEVAQDVAEIATLPPIASSWHLPAWLMLPQWNFTLPAWLPSFPDWHLSFPDWHLSLPSWLPTWTIHLPTWLKELPDWGIAGLIWLLRLLLIVTLLLITGFIFLQFGVLLGSPWYGKLSEEIERLQTGQLVRIEVNPAIEIWRAIAYELKKLGLTVSIGLPLLLLNLFVGPGIAIATIGGIALASLIACLDFLDAAVERRRPRFRQKLAIVFRSLPASATFGVTCLALVSIPLINLLAIPLCVVAGTLFFCDRVLDEVPSSETIDS